MAVILKILYLHLPRSFVLYHHPHWALAVHGCVRRRTIWWVFTFFICVSSGAQYGEEVFMPAVFKSRQQDETGILAAVFQKGIDRHGINFLRPYCFCQLPLRGRAFVIARIVKRHQCHRLPFQPCRKPDFFLLRLRHWKQRKAQCAGQKACFHLFMSLSLNKNLSGLAARWHPARPETARAA